MGKKGKKKKESDDSVQPPPRKHGLKLLWSKFKYSVVIKKIAPKMEIKEESKEYSVDNDMMLKMKLKTSQSMDVLGNEADTVFIKKNKAEAEKNESDVSTANLPKGYVEPWDYNLNNYPITLPIRRPHSGDPAIRDEEEFGQSSSNRDHDGELTTAKELGLEDVAKPELLFFQLPLSFPLPRAEPVTEENTDINDDVNTEVTASDWSDQKRRHESIQGCRLEELPGGLMGKILVYNSGKLKMKLGDALFDVSAGMKCEFLQEVVAINTREKHFCSLGKIRKRLIVTPDIDYLLDI